MKTRFTQIILLLFFSNLFSQSINRLDLNYGFKTFKFGTDISKLTNIEDANNIVNNMNEYIYVGDDINKIQEVDISRISLYFYKNKLSAIGISFGWNENYTLDEYNRVNYGLNNSFGKPTTNCIGQSNTLNCDIWVGNKVKLEHNRINGESGKIIGYIILEEKNMRQSRINSDF